MLAPDARRDSGTRKLLLPSLVIFVVLIITAAIWTYTTRDWNASGTHKTGAPSGTAPSEGGKPLILNK